VSKKQRHKAKMEIRSEALHDPCLILKPFRDVAGDSKDRKYISGISSWIVPAFVLISIVGLVPFMLDWIAHSSDPTWSSTWPPLWYQRATIGALLVLFVWASYQYHNPPAPLRLKYESCLRFHARQHLDVLVRFVQDQCGDRTTRLLVHQFLITYHPAKLAEATSETEN